MLQDSKCAMARFTLLLLLLQVAKVSDFGVSAKLMDGATHRSTASLGTITHMAPECECLPACD